MKNIHRVFFALLFFVAPVSALPQAKIVEGASLPRLDLSRPAEHGGLNNYAFSPDGKKLAGASWIIRSAPTTKSGNYEGGIRVLHRRTPLPPTMTP